MEPFVLKFPGNIHEKKKKPVYFNYGLSPYVKDGN